MMDKQVRYLRKSQNKESLSNTRDSIIEIMRKIFKLSSGDVKVTIEEDRETRSAAQNRLLWLWNGELKAHIEKHIGEVHDSEDIHDYVVGVLLPKRVVTIDGNPEVKRTSTRKLKVKDFAEYLSKYEMWAAEKYQCLFSRPADLYHYAIMQEADKEEQTDGL